MREFTEDRVEFRKDRIQNHSLQNKTIKMKFGHSLLPQPSTSTHQPNFYRPPPIPPTICQYCYHHQPSVNIAITTDHRHRCHHYPLSPPLWPQALTTPSKITYPNSEKEAKSRTKIKQPVKLPQPPPALVCLILAVILVSFFDFW